MRPKLNVKSASLVVLFYLGFSILAGFFSAIFFGGIVSSQGNTSVAGVIDGGMYGTIIVMVVLLFISIFVFKDDRKDIFFERKPFNLSKLYYLLPLAWIGVSFFALYNVDFSAYSPGVIMLVIVASLAIGVNEEIVTRGLLLVGLRNSGFAEWKAWLVTVVVFSLLHLVNMFGGDNVSIVLVTITGGTILYVSRRVFNNLFVPIGLHALYDTAFYLLTGVYLTGESLPDEVLDIQLGSFLVLLAATILFLFFGRGLFIRETTGWE